MSLKDAVVTAVKYLAHGGVFTTIVFEAEFFWFVVLAPLKIFNPVYALIAVFVGLAVVWGFFNAVISNAFWFPVRQGWKVCLLQGVVVFFTLFLIEFLPAYLMVPLLASVSLLEYVMTVVVINVAYAFLDGYIAKAIAGHWKVRGVQAKVLAGETPVTPEPVIEPNNPDSVRCPTCHDTSLVVASDGSAYCIDCKRGIRKETYARASS